MFRESYTAQEWRTLQFAPHWVFTAVASIDGGPNEKKVAAFVKEVSEWAQFKEPLVQEVLLSIFFDVVNVLEQYNADSRDLVDGLKDVADLLDRKATPDQAKHFKGSMLLIGRHVAEASGGSDASAKGMLAVAIIAKTLRAI